MILLLGLMIACSNSQQLEDNRNSDFKLFLDKFTSLSLPLSIIGVSDVLSYDDVIMDSLNDFVANPILKPLNTYDFIQQKYPINNDNKYYCVYKYRTDNYFLVCLKQDNKVQEKYRLMLNLYDLKGELLDTLYIAGRSDPEFRRYCSITRDLQISTYYFTDIVDDFSKKCQQCNFYATEIRNNYIISNKGKFTLTNKINERAYFTMWGIRNVVSRVDTINGKFILKSN